MKDQGIWCFIKSMSLDIDMLVENVYRDRIDRANFHKNLFNLELFYI